MARKKPNKRKGGAGSRSRVRGKAGVRIHQRSATSGAYVVRGSRPGSFKVKAFGGRVVPIKKHVSFGGAPSADTWPRYPLFDSGDPMFSERAEEELAGFGER
jgi:hypothetical protein